MRTRGLDETYPSTRFRLGRWLGMLVVLLLVIAGTWVVARHTDWLQRARSGAHTVSQGQLPAWMHAKGQLDNGAGPVSVDPYAERWDKLARWIETVDRRLDALEKRQPPSTPQKTAQERPKPLKKSLTRVSYERKEPITDMPGDTTRLHAGTYIPVVLLPRQNSDREGCSTVKVREHVKDSATGQHILIPQGAQITMCYKSKDLQWGEERVEVGLDTLTLPGGKEIHLPKAAGIDQIGQEGWSGDVDHHYWRLLSAVLIRGVLRGGAQVVNTQISGGGAGNLAGGIAQEGAQVGQQQTQPFVNIRPTIITPEGSPENIRLHTGVSLPIYQEPTHALR